MRKRYALDSRWVANVLLFAGLPLLILVLVVGFPWIRKAPASLTLPPQATPTSAATDLPVVQKPQATPPLSTATTVPVAVVITGTATPLALAALPTAPLLPDPGPGDIAVVTPEPTEPIAVVPTLQPSPPAAEKPAPTKTRDPNLLPNGVRYGDHKPNLPDRIVRIASPNIKLDTSVYEVYINRKQNVWEVADYAAGHNFNSPNPGEGGNIVLSGHNNWRGEVFRYLEFLKPGDLVQVWTLEGKEYDYKVADIQKLKEAGVSMAQRLKNAEVMNPTDHEQLTLITCWPYTTYTHRLIVTALPIN